MDVIWEIMNRVRCRGTGLENPNNSRPIKAIRLSDTMWQIVYADE